MSSTKFIKHIIMNKPDPSRSLQSAVPDGRLARMSKLGSLAAGLAAGMLAEGARKLAAGERPRARDLLLTPANAQRVADQLAQLRGAAMKVGQLLSMDAGQLMPPELATILARLREDARTMPMSQVVTVLEKHWGKGWENRFERFSFTPVAAASIGQVHRASSCDHRPLAIKIQYPGVRQSIDSDVDNVATLLRLSGLLPKHLDIAPLLSDAKQQLHAEADYQAEAEQTRRFARLLHDSPDFALPEPDMSLTAPDILVMSWVEGVAVESLTDAPQATRDQIMTLLLGLLFRELFEFRLIQTDPNFANYRFDPVSGRIGLLDFGATRAYAPTVVEAYRMLMSGAQRQHTPSMDQAAQAIGYFKADIGARQREAVLSLFSTACEPLRQQGAYDFGASDLAQRIRDAGFQLSADKNMWHTPPADALFLHRKLGGLYLLATRLRARVDVTRIAEAYF